MTDQPVRYAKQDEPWPEDKLPKDTAIVDEESARNMLKFAHYRPGANQLSHTAIDVVPEWSERHARMLIQMLWKGLKPGATLFVPPNFPVFPPTNAKRAHLEGYKQFTK